ncbi:MAG: type II 3-dehydroquinate dehydratase, partial [Sphaerotilus sp.]|nr:type II 3-dehydroquinate dehydratase [Sphaerotilus sp.]
MRNSAPRHPQRPRSARSMPKVLVVNGPNLNLLGTREPHIYGSTTLADVENGLRVQGEALGVELLCFQS